MGSKRSPGLRHGFGDGFAFLPDSSQGFTGLRPCGLHPVQLFCQLFDLRFGLFYPSLGVIQIGLCFGNGIRAVLHGLLESLDLAFQLRNLGGRFFILLLITLQILLRGNGRGVSFTEGVPVLLISNFTGFNFEADFQKKTGYLQKK